MENPYAPGAMPTYLAGRGTQLTLIADRATRMRALGRSGGPLLGFHAPRGIGKTSLLRAAQRAALDEGYMTAWVTGRDDEPMLPGLVRELRREAERTAPSGPAAGLLHRLSQVEVQVGVPGASVAAQLDTTDAAPSPMVEEVLEDAARFAQSQDLHGLVLFVDEFQDLQLADRRSLVIALQHFDGDPRGCPVTLVAAGLPALPGAVTQAGTFGERSRFEELGALSDVAVAEALQRPAEPHGVTWSTAALEAGIALAHGYGHAVQLVGAETWDYARPERGSVLEAGHVHGGQERVEQAMSSLMAARLARTTTEQRRVLNALAHSGGEATRGELAQLLGVEPNALSRVRQELLDRGIVEPAGHGRLRFALPEFGGFIQQQIDHDDVPGERASFSTSPIPPPRPLTEPPAAQRRRGGTQGQERGPER